MYVFLVTIIANIFNVNLYKVSGRIYYVPVIYMLINDISLETAYMHVINMYTRTRIVITPFRSGNFALRFPQR